MDTLGAVLYNKGDLDGAQRLLLEALAARKHTLGERHPATVASLANSGMLLKEKGRLVEAEPLLREAFAAMRAFRDGGDSDPKLYSELLICGANLGSLLKDRGQMGEAEERLREAVELMPAAVGPAEAATLHASMQLGLVLMSKGELDESEEVLSASLHASRGALGDYHPQVLANVSHLAALANKRGDQEMALMLHQQVLAGFAAIEHPMTHRSAGHVITLLAETGRPDEAAAIASEYGVITNVAGGVEGGVEGGVAGGVEGVEADGVARADGAEELEEGGATDGSGHEADGGTCKEGGGAGATAGASPSAPAAAEADTIEVS
jgi:tetratricopeptide (TPR) repeat protein